MKRFLVCLLLILIALFLIYCAQLDGLVHIKAFAEPKCEFCEYLETYDLEAEKQTFVPNIIPTAKSIGFELVLYAHLTHGHDRAARHVLEYGVPFTFCPNCGRRISGVERWTEWEESP